MSADIHIDVVIFEQWLDFVTCIVAFLFCKQKRQSLNGKGLSHTVVRKYIKQEL